MGLTTVSLIGPVDSTPEPSRFVTIIIPVMRTKLPWAGGNERRIGVSGYFF